MKTAADREQLKDLRGPLTAYVVNAMRRDNIPTVKEWAAHHGLARPTLYALLRGRATATGVLVKPSLDFLKAFSDAVRAPLHELLYILEPDALGAGTAFSDQVRKVPVYVPGRVGAGPLQSSPTDQTVYVEAEFAQGKDLIGFRIEGNSMEGGKRPIFDGDIVLVNRHDTGTNGSVVVARIEDDGYVCKKVRDTFLVSTNPEYTQSGLTIISPDRISQIVGRVVRVISAVD